MSDIIVINLWQFASVYTLLIIVLWVMKKCKVSQGKLLIIGSIRMSVQLVLAGLILTYIFKNPHPLFVIFYIFVMILMSIYTIYSRNKEMNNRFILVMALSLSACGLSVIVFFLCGIVGVSFFNPQYAIPISGMILGNAMTGIS